MSSREEERERKGRRDRKPESEQGSLSLSVTADISRNLYKSSRT
jgi:hypothetical protein